jgi:hypothetical protein
MMVHLDHITNIKQTQLGDGTPDNPVECCLCSLVYVECCLCSLVYVECCLCSLVYVECCLCSLAQLVVLYTRLLYFQAITVVYRTHAKSQSYF